MPLAWGEAGRDHWDVTLHCPNCDWIGGGVYDEELVERFDEELDQGTEALVRDLQRLMRANMEDEIDRFVAALAGRRDLAGRLLGLTPLRVALHDALGDELEGAPLGRRQRRQLGARLLDDRERAASFASSSAPVAAMRSQTASASAAVRSARRSSCGQLGSRSRARISGSVTVPSSRSVPRALPVRLAGPETSRTSSSSWKARPIAAAERARARRGVVRRRAARARRAGRPPRTGGRSSARSGAGSARADGRRPRRRRAAAARRPRAPRRPPTARARRRRCAAGGELGERAREQQVAGRDRDRAPGRGDDGRARRGAGRRRVEHVVVDEARAVDQLDGDGGAHEPRSPRRRRRRRRRGTRAAGAGACRRPRSSRSRARRARAVTAPPARRAAARRAPARRERRPPARRTASAAATLVIAASRSAAPLTPTSPTWIAMIPPAVRT